jgi:hypothetical protein
LTVKRFADLLFTMNNINIQAVANEFGMPVEKFVELYRRRRLPGQLPHGSVCMEQDSEIDLGIKLPVMKGDAWKRIRRVTRLTGETVQEFVTSAIMSTVRGCEEIMITSPRTGEALCRSWDLDDGTGEELAL